MTKTRFVKLTDASIVDEDYPVYVSITYIKSMRVSDGITYKEGVPYTFVETGNRGEGENVKESPAEILQKIAESEGAGVKESLTGDANIPEIPEILQKIAEAEGGAIFPSPCELKAVANLLMRIANDSRIKLKRPGNETCLNVAEWLESLAREGR